jgi:hypothetical protein
MHACFHDLLLLLVIRKIAAGGYFGRSNALGTGTAHASCITAVDLQ